MRAVVVHGAKDVRVEEREPKAPGPQEVQVRIAYGGICGSDLHYYHEGKVGSFVVREPLVIGHEVVGRVVLDGRVASDADHALVSGTPVTIHPASPGHALAGIEHRPKIWPETRYLGSAATWPHTQGAMSDLFTARADQIRVLPEGLPLERGVLPEPLGVALHAIRRAGGVAGRRVLVSGAGSVGLLAAGACVALGAAEVNITDVLAEPLTRARALGVNHALQMGVDEVPNQAFDIVLECAGAAPALSQAIKSVVRGGVVVQIGMLPGEPRAVSLAELVVREIDLRGSFRFDDEIDHAVELLTRVPIFGLVVTHVFDADDAVAAFDCASDSRASSKVVLRLDDSLPAVFRPTLDAP